MVAAPILKGYDSPKALLMTNETIRKIAFLMLGRIQEKLGSGCTKLFPGETFHLSLSMDYSIQRDSLLSCIYILSSLFPIRVAFYVCNERLCLLA